MVLFLADQTRQPGGEPSRAWDETVVWRQEGPRQREGFEPAALPQGELLTLAKAPGGGSGSVVLRVQEALFKFLDFAQRLLPRRSFQFQD